MKRTIELKSKRKSKPSKPTTNGNANKFDIYQAVTDRIISQLEQGIIPWKKSWQGNEPINYITRKPYRGINTLLLKQGGEYATFKQIKDSGGSVLKGEKSQMIVFWKVLERENPEGEKEKIPFLKYYNVFHISQTTLESKLEPINPAADHDPIEAAESVISDYTGRTGVKPRLVTGTHQAYYTPSTDEVTMPTLNQFTSPEAYYSTYFHELAHSTGHKSRLNRLDATAAFGSQVYSKEELVAEISSAQVMSFTGIELPDTFENSVAYIKNWLSKLKDDKKLIVTAASAAQKATDLILNTPAYSETETESETTAG